jgi:hypothetical protein
VADWISMKRRLNSNCLCLTSDGGFYDDENAADGYCDDDADNYGDGNNSGDATADENDACDSKDWSDEAVDYGNDHNDYGGD